MPAALYVVFVVNILGILMIGVVAWTAAGGASVEPFPPDVAVGRIADRPLVPATSATQGDVPVAIAAPRLPVPDTPDPAPRPWTFTADGRVVFVDTN